VSSGLGPIALLVLLFLCSHSSAPGANAQAAKGVADDPTALVRRDTRWPRNRTISRSAIRSARLTSAATR
jgi:hypothetical protein